MCPARHPRGSGYRFYPAGARLFYFDDQSAMKLSRSDAPQRRTVACAKGPGAMPPAANDSKQEDLMSSRRDFLKTLAGVSAGAYFLADGAIGLARQPLQGAKHAPPMVAGRRVKTIDVHCHVDVPGIADFLKGTPLERAVNRPAPTGRQLQGVSDFNIDVPLGPERLAK